MKTLSELVAELTAEDRIEMLKILTEQISAAEYIHHETEQTAAKRTIRNELLKASIST
jgi:nicotinic acid mononucleotide adenylyltransferase